MNERKGSIKFDLFKYKYFLKIERYIFLTLNYE